MKKLSVAIATYNEEANISDCLKSVKDIADEIVIVDGSSSDKTVEIAKSFDAKVYLRPNYPIFHINKQESFDLSEGEWVLYLDADERITPELSKEIKEIIGMNSQQIEDYQKKIKNRRLFLRHQNIINQRDGLVGTMEGDYTAFYFPRLNFFLGRYLRYGGVYPDGVIRLFKRGKAYLPCKNVHEQMVVEGRVGWLQHALIHRDSPNFTRYLQRNNRYIDLLSEEFKQEGVEKNIIQFIRFFLYKPVSWFLLTSFRHKGILDGWQGLIFSAFSALRFPKAYWRYLKRR